MNDITSAGQAEWGATTNDDRAEQAAAAIDTFQRLTRFDGPHDHRHDPETAEELIGDLVCNLGHYADRAGVDFQRAVDNGMGMYREEVEEERLTAGLYMPGDLVQASVRRGVVASAQPRGDDLEYYVLLVGSAELFTLRAEELSPAPPFPRLQVGGKTVDSPSKAEQQLAELYARIATDGVYGFGPGREVLEAKADLVEALTDWGQTTEPAIRDSLTNQIEGHLRRLKDEHRAAVRLAQGDFPTSQPVIGEPLPQQGLGPTPGVQADDAPRQGRG